MIYDKVTNIKKYLNIHKNIDKAINFILNNDMKYLKHGINQIDETLFYNKFDVTALDVKNAVFESHDKYLDLHILAVGDEYIGHRFVEDLNEEVEYNQKDDCYLYVTKPSKTIYQNTKSFAIFFPWDAHAPKMKANEKEITKVVFKILYD